MQGISENFEKIKFYLSVSSAGVLRGGLGLILEHPLESVKTQWQDHMTIKNAKEIINYVYRKKGIIGFYRGFLPNLLRVASKQFYRWPMMLFFPKFFEKHLPKNLNEKFPGLSKILSGLAIANIELFLICPLDRLKIYFMTTTSCHGGKSNLLLKFFQDNSKSLLKELFRGFGPTFWRGNLSWISFMYLDYFLKRVLKRYRKSDTLGLADLILVSIGVGVGNVLSSKVNLIIYLVMPFDFAKTQMLKEGTANSSTLSVILQYYRHCGLKGLYTGWKFKALQYAVNSIFTVVTLERLEKKSKKI